MVRLQPPSHRLVARDSHEVLGLRALGRQYRQRRTQRRALDSQLWEQAAAFYPAAADALVGHRRRRRDIHAALLVAPSPTAARKIGPKRMADALRQAGRVREVAKGAAELLDELRAPYPRLPLALERVHGEALIDTVEVVRAADASLDRLTTALLSRAAEHPLWPIYSSFPGLGQLVGSLLLAELGDDPDRFQSARGLLAYAGVAPVTRQSGGMLTVHRRRVRNQPLAAAVKDWTMPLLTGSPAARALYDQRRVAGDRHNAAARRLLSKYLRALHHCVRTGEVYDERRMLTRES
jgi:transposase